MIRILGIDPGSRLTGYGVIEMQRGRPVWLGSGCIRTRGEDLAARLKIIYQGVAELVEEYVPFEVAIESVYVHRNADSALKLGQARGTAIAAVANHAIPLVEYTPSQIKKSVVGRGNAAKAQVQHMVSAMLALKQLPQSDAADALAVALCHGHTRSTLHNVRGVSGMRSRRWR
jgi:crossover junction endodeoxyribonuclease RuvC